MGSHQGLPVSQVMVSCTERTFVNRNRFSSKHRAIQSFSYLPIFFWLEGIGLQRELVVMFDLESRFRGTSVTLDFLLYLLTMVAFLTRVHYPMWVSYRIEKVLWYLGTPFNVLQVLLHLEWVIFW